MRMILMVVVFLVTIVLLAISFRAVYYAFIKKKDERSKWIVIKSMANSFVAITVMQTVLLAIKWLNYDSYDIWWSNFKKGIYIEPVMLSFIVFGIILIVNTKKHGGSL